MQAILNIATRAARKAGAYVLRERDRLETPCNIELLAAIQQQAEFFMTEIIEKAYPDHGIVTASTSASDKTYDTTWYIEIVSGLENLVRQIPHYAIAIVIEEHSKPKYTLVFDPNCDEIFTASIGGGAKCNNHKIRVSNMSALHAAVFSTSTLQAGQLDHFQSLNELNDEGCAIYNQGCSMLSLAYVAAGRIAGFFGGALSNTVINAAVLLIKEAGGLSVDLQGGLECTKKGELLCANPKLLKLLVPTFKSNKN